MVHYTDTLSFDLRVPPVNGIPVAAQPSDAPNAILARTRRMVGITIPSTAAFGQYQVLYSWDELFQSIAPLVPHTKFLRFSADALRLRFTPLGNTFWRGMFAVSVGDVDHMSSTMVTSAGLSSLPTTLIDMSSTEATEITVPWSFPNGKCLYSEIARIAQVVIWIVAPPACDSTPGVTHNFSFQLEASFVNPELHDPVTNSGALPAATPRTAILTSIMAPAYVQSSSVPKEAEAKASSGTVSSLLDAASHISGSAKMIPAISPIASGLELAFKGAASVARLFGFSKPPNLTTPVYASSISFPGYQQFDGVVTGEVLSASQIPYVATDPNLQHAATDYTDLHNTLKMQTLVNVYSVGTAPGLIGTCKVWPFYCSAFGNNLVLPHLAYAAHMGLFWTGDLAYKVIIPASSVTRARLAITYAAQPLATFSEDVRYQFVDVTGTTTVDFVIPYMGSTPYKRRPNVATDNTDDFVNGYLQFWLMSQPLSQVPGETPVPLTLALFCGGTDNFNVAVVNSIDKTFEAPVRQTALAQGFVGLDNSVAFKGILADDEILSMRARLHRPSATIVTLALTPTPVSIQLNTLYTAEHAGFITRFKTWRGSMTLYLTIPQPISSDILIEHLVDGKHSSQIIWSSRDDPSIAITLPVSQQRGMITQQNATLGFFNSALRFSADQALTLSIRLAFCDDLSVGLLRHPLITRLIP